LTGREPAETVAFSLDSRDYELDLSKKNAAKLRKALEPYVAAARRSGIGGRGRRRESGPGAAARDVTER
jgi:Lsr2